MIIGGTLKRKVLRDGQQAMEERLKKTPDHMYTRPTEGTATTYSGLVRTQASR